MAKQKIMSEFIFLFRGGNAKILQQSPEKWQQHMQLWMQWMSKLTQQGTLIGAQPLNQTGRQIKGNKKIVTDGPFMEGKEMVGGYLICKADNYDAAVIIAKGCPILESEDGIVEVREIQALSI